MKKNPVHRTMTVLSSLVSITGAVFILASSSAFAGHEIESQGHVDIPLPGGSVKQVSYRVSNLDNVSYQFGSITLRCIFKGVLPKFSPDNRLALLRRLNEIVIEPAEETTMLGRTLGLSRSTVKPGAAHGPGGISYENPNRKFEDPEVRFEGSSGRLYIKYRPEGETSCEQRAQVVAEIPAALRGFLQEEIRANRLNPAAVSRNLQNSMDQVGRGLFTDAVSEAGSSEPAQ